jgi:hypothetical protein
MRPFFIWNLEAFFCYTLLFFKVSSAFYSEIPVQCCGSGSRILILCNPDLGSWIPDPTTGTKENGEKKFSQRILICLPSSAYLYEYLVLFQQRELLLFQY